MFYARNLYFACFALMFAPDVLHARIKLFTALDLYLHHLEKLCVFLKVKICTRRLYIIRYNNRVSFEPKISVAIQVRYVVFKL